MESGFSLFDVEPSKIEIVLKIELKIIFSKNRHFLPVKTILFL